MKKQLSILAIVIFLLVFATGCWDSLDINKRNIVTTILIDKDDEGFIGYFEIANTDSARSGSNEVAGGKKYVTVKASGETIADARTALEAKLDSPVYLEAVRALVLTENLTNDDVAEYLNRLRADKDYRKKVITVTTSSDAESILKFSETSSESVGYYIEDLFKHLVDEGQTFYRPTARFIENISSAYSGFLIPSIVLNENVLALNGYSVVDDTKTIGLIPVKESKGLVFMKSDKAKWHYTVPLDGINYTIEVHLGKKKTKTMYKEDKISYIVNFSFDAEMEYDDVRCPCAFTDDIKQSLTKELEKMIKADIVSTIKTSQEKFKTDYLSFDDEFHMAYPAEYHKLKWREEYPNIKVDVGVKVELDTQILMDYDPHKAE